MDLTADRISDLHILNSASKGSVKCKFYEAGGNVYFNSSLVPAGVDAEEVEYTVLNMFSINTATRKGNLSVTKVAGVSDENTRITNSTGTGIFYGLTKNKTELMPFHRTAIMDVSPRHGRTAAPGY